MKDYRKVDGITTKLFVCPDCFDMPYMEYTEETGRLNVDYRPEDMQTDIDWLIGFGIDETEAKSFITGLLNKRLVD